MRKQITTVLLLFWFAASCAALEKAEKKVALTGAWLQDGIKWINAPAEINAHLQTGQAALLYFGPDHTFAIIYCVVNRVPKQYMTISHGDGQVVYLGKWEAAGDQISTTYRLMSRTVQIKGEKLPGPELRATIKKSHVLLVLQSKSYRRVDALDKNAADVVNRAKQQSNKDTVDSTTKHRKSLLG